MVCTDGCLRPTPAQAHCGACHVTFGGVRGFDLHRRGGLCAIPTGMRLDCRGVWRTPMSDEARARLAS